MRDVKQWSRAAVIGIVAAAGQPAYAAPCPQERTRSFVGEARSLAGGELLYAEQHDEAACGAAPLSLRTRYVNGAGESYAERRLTYERAPVPWAPDYAFSDARSGRREAARVEGGEVVISLRESRHGATQTNRIPYSPDLVIDGGFDQFIRANLDRLRNGEAVTFRFVVPARLDAYVFTLERDRFPAGTSAATHLPLVLRIDNWLVRMFIEPVRVVYSLAPFELQRYAGVSNVRDARGELLSAVLTYPLAPHQSAWRVQPARATEVR